MLNLKKIAVTGGLASGKSTVCKIFRELGAYVISADEIVHELLSIDSDLSRRVTHSLNLPVVTNDKELREAIAEKVFKNPNQLKSLENILHPKILQKIEELYKRASSEEKGTCFVVEMPLLFEIRTEGFYDTVIAVLTDEEIARERYKKEGYALRMKQQMSPKAKASLADHIIDNNGTLQELETQVKHLYTTLQ